MQTLLSYLSQPLLMWELIIVIIILLLGGMVKMVSLRRKRGKWPTTFSTIIDAWVEIIYHFFDEILWEKAPSRVKSYVVNLFLIILIANSIGFIIDVLGFPFPFFETHIQNPTSNIHFTLTLAIASVLLMLFVEIKVKGIGRFFYAYLPLWGKGMLTLSPEGFPKRTYYLLRPIIKLCDIVLSLFIGMLDAIGILAKVISMAFRLYGNMMAGSVLLIIIIGMLGTITQPLLSGRKFPFLVPMIFYAQSVLVTVIQAFVFSLLTSVFIKMSLEGEEKSDQKEETTLQSQLVQHIQ